MRITFANDTEPGRALLFCTEEAFPDVPLRLSLQRARDHRFLGSDGHWFTQPVYLEVDQRREGADLVLVLGPEIVSRLADMAHRVGLLAPDGTLFKGQVTIRGVRYVEPPPPRSPDWEAERLRREAATRAANERARRGAEEQAAREEVERLRREAEVKAAREEAERLRLEAEVKAAREEAERLRLEAEVKAAREEAARLRREAEEKAAREAEEAEEAEPLVVVAPPSRVNNAPTSAPEQVVTNSVGMEFVLIPAGKFWMGSGDDDDEKPRHEVTISRPFYLGRYPVTQAQWEAVMGDNPSRFKGPDRPVENVSWEDAQAFIRKLNAQEGHNRYRLPTEAEWEYACRAGSTSRYCFGDDESQLGNYAWYGDNSGDETHPVGQKQANAWGLYDMHGNVYEWCEDWAGEYRAEAVVDPQGPQAGEFRVLRGGSWGSGAGICRSAFRSDSRPAWRHSDNGFRLVRSSGH